jgi:hypothetical protein
MSFTVAPITLCTGSSNPSKSAQVIRMRVITMFSPFSGDTGYFIWSGRRDRERFLRSMRDLIAPSWSRYREGAQFRICPSCHAPLERDEIAVGDLFSLRLIAAGVLQRNRRQLPIQIMKLLGRQRGIEQMGEVFALNGILDGVIKI